MAAVDEKAQEKLLDLRTTSSPVHGPLAGWVDGVTESARMRVRIQRIVSFLRRD